MPANGPPAPGWLLQEALIRRGWSQSVLSEVMGRPPQWASEVMSGRKEITRISALQLAAAFGTTPEYWLDAQDAYRLHLLDQDPAHLAKLEGIRRRASLTDLDVRGEDGIAGAEHEERPGLSGG